MYIIKTARSLSIGSTCTSSGGDAAVFRPCGSGTAGLDLTGVPAYMFSSMDSQSAALGGRASAQRSCALCAGRFSGVCVRTGANGCARVSQGVCLDFRGAIGTFLAI